MGNEIKAQKWVKKVIRVEMTRRGITHKELSERLAILTIEIGEHALRNKIARGTFSAAFFVYCLEALEMDQMKLDYIDQEFYRMKLADAGLQPVPKDEIERDRKSFDDELMREEVRAMIKETHREFMDEERNMRGKS